MIDMGNDAEVSYPVQVVLFQGDAARTGLLLVAAGEGGGAEEPLVQVGST